MLGPFVALPEFVCGLVGPVIVAAIVAACGPAGRDGAAACSEGDPAAERWGTDCTCCHPEFGVAGSIDPDGPPVSRIVVIDRDGRRAVMSPNPYGNFFRHVRLDPPLEVSVEGPGGASLVMEALAPHGACNRCHGLAGGPPLVAGP